MRLTVKHHKTEIIIEDDGLRELVKRKGLKIIEGQNDS
jgi:hypothetical protein